MDEPAEQLSVAHVHLFRECASRYCNGVVTTIERFYEDLHREDVATISARPSSPRHRLVVFRGAWRYLSPPSAESSVEDRGTTKQLTVSFQLPGSFCGLYTCNYGSRMKTKNICHFFLPTKIAHCFFPVSWKSKPNTALFVCLLRCKKKIAFLASLLVLPLLETDNAIPPQKKLGLLQRSCLQLLPPSVVGAFVFIPYC